MIIEYYRLDVITCHVSHFSFILIVRRETKEPHDVAGAAKEGQDWSDHLKTILI